MRILIIDDDSMLVRLLKAMLQRGLEGQVCIASAGSRGTAEDIFPYLGPRGRPNLVLCDRELPDGVGEDVIRRMREFEALRSVPVLGITGSDDEQVHQRLLDAGALLVLNKVDLRDRLIDVVNQHAA